MRLGYREIYTWSVSLAVLFYEILDLETQPPRACGLHAAEGGSQPAAGRVGRGLALARLPRSLTRAPGRRGGSHVTISASPSHGWEQCSERGPRDSGRRACHPFWAARSRAATTLKAPELLRAQARAVAFRDAPGFEGFPERQPHARFSSLPRSLGSWSAWG